MHYKKKRFEDTGIVPNTQKNVVSPLPNKLQNREISYTMSMLPTLKNAVPFVTSTSVTNGNDGRY